MADPWVFASDEARADLVVCDEHGVQHASVLCNTSASAAPARAAEGPAFVVAMCDFFECVDKAVMYEPSSLKYPVRRWPLEQESPGVITCLVCLGS